MSGQTDVRTVHKDVLAVPSGVDHSPRSRLLQDVGGLPSRQRPAGDAGGGVTGGPRRAGGDLF